MNQSHLRPGNLARRSYGVTRSTAALRGAVAALATLVGFAWGSVASAATIYVDKNNPSCSNSGPGSAAVPYCSINSAVDQNRLAGTTILVKPGTYKEQVTVATSGTAANPYIIQADGAVILEGSESFSTTGQWSLVSGSVYLASGVTSSPSQVLVGGVRYTSSSVAPASLPTRTYRYVSGTGLYVNAGGPNPGSVGTLVSRDNYGFRLDRRSNVVVRGFTVQNYADRGIYLTGPLNGTTIENNITKFCGKNGIGVISCSTSVFRNNVASDHGDHGIYVVSSGNLTFDGNEAMRNVRPNVRAANGFYVHGTSNCVFRRNRAYRNDDSGWNLDQGASFNLFTNNAAWLNGDHGYDHLNGSSDNVHIHDIAYRNLRDGFSYEGNAPRGRVYNSISIENGITDNHFNLWIDSDSQSGFQSNHNIFWNSTSQIPIKMGSNGYATIAAWSAVTGNDADSKQANPAFVDSSTANFRLTAGSPAIDAAISSLANWPATDFEGRPRNDDPGTPNLGAGPPVDFADIGIYEFEPNLIPNASFEQNLNGWTARTAGQTLERVAGGHDGAFSAQMRGLATTAQFGLNDSPDWITAAEGPAAKYRFGAWVRSIENAGSVTLRVREYLSGVLQKTSTSTPVTLTGSWQFVSVDHVTMAAGSQLDFNVLQNPVIGGETFQVDDISARLVTVDNPPQVTAPATVSGAESDTIVVLVSGNDPEGEPFALSANLSGLPAGHNAVFVVDSTGMNGTFKWVPTYFDARPEAYSVVFTASNVQGSSKTTLITVTNVDPAPIVDAPATVVANENGPIVIGVTAFDPDSTAIDSLTANLSGLPAGHNAVFTPAANKRTGTFTWTPTFFDAGGPYTVVFTAKNTLTGRDTTRITVNPVDQPPTISAPSDTTAGESQPFNLIVTAIDFDGQPVSSFSANLSNLPAGHNASFSVSPDKSSGTFKWTPTAGTPPGPYPVIFTAFNALTTVDTMRVRVDRAPVMNAPIAVEVGEGKPLSVAVTASDPDGDPIAALTADLSVLPAGHNAVFTPAGDNLSGVLTWTPTAADGRLAPYLVRFIATNALADSSITAVTVDQPPDVTGPAAVSVGEGDPLTVNLTIADPDGDTIDSLKADLSGLPAGHNAVFTPAANKLSGTFTWTPTFAHGGAGPYPVVFTASNTLHGVLTTTITVDQHPVVTAPANFVSTENTLLSMSVSVADPDGDAVDSLKADLSNLPAGHDAVFTPAANKLSGTLTWTPTFVDSGSYVVNFTAKNALTGVAASTLRIGNVDRAPVVTAPAVADVGENEQLTLVIAVADPDGDAITSLGAVVTALPGGHNALFTPAANKLSGTLTWTPTSADGRAAPYNVRFDAANALTGSATTAVTVDQQPVVVAPPNASATEDQTLVLSVTASDPDGQALTDFTADLSSLPAGHNAVFTPNASKTAGTLTWTPDFSTAPGPYTVRFVAANVRAGRDSTSILVGNVDRKPVVTAPAGASAGVDQQLTVVVTAVDPDGEPITSFVADLTGMPAGHGAQFTVAPDKSAGTLTWTPREADAPGSPYIVTFTASNALVTSSATAILVDRPPVVTAPDVVAASENQPLVIQITAEDLDAFDVVQSLTSNFTGLPAGNNATFTPAGDHLSGTFSWTPTFEDAPGPYVVYFMASNALTGIDSTVVNVTGVDRAPIVSAVSDTLVAVDSEFALVVTVMDPEGDPITLLEADFSGLPGDHNAVFTPAGDQRSGTMTWTPQAHHAPGPYNVAFTATNALSGQTSTSIRINRRPLVTAPVTENAAEGQGITIHVSVLDPDGEPIDSLFVDLSALPFGNNAVFTHAPDFTAGTLTWTPTFSDVGSYPVTFTANNELTGTWTTSIDVGNFDRHPIVVAPDTVSVAEGAQLTVTVTASDPDGEPIGSLTADLSALPAGNNAQFTAAGDQLSGTLTWTPTLDDGVGVPYLVGFIATNALSDTATTAIEVDQRPIVTAPGTLSSGEGAPISIPLTADDPDGDPILALSANLTGLPAGHNAVFTAAADKRSGTLTWTPTYNDSRPSPYVVTFTALNNLSGAALTALTISNTDRAPVVVAPSDTVAKGGVPMVVHVAVADADGEAIASLQADYAALPAGHNATFTAAADKRSGTFTWTPNAADPLGPFPIIFTASNALSGKDTTAISVDQAPIVSATTPVAANEGAEVTVPVTVSDPNGDAVDSLKADLSGLPAGHNAVFTPAANHLSGTLSWTPTFDDAGGPYAVSFSAYNSLVGSKAVDINVANSNRPPFVNAPVTVNVNESNLVTVHVTAGDLDGEPITSLTAGLGVLPAGHDAVFSVAADKMSGTLTWTPTHADSGSYPVQFTASNAISGASVTHVKVANVDRAPVVTAPASASGNEGAALSVELSVSDPDGDAITGITADLGVLPAGHDAVFTPAGDNLSGTLTWTPSYADSRPTPYNLTFTAFNALSSFRTTSITVIHTNQDPVITAPVTVAAAENTPVTIEVTAQDFDVETITALSADLSGLPFGHNAVFTAAANKMSGTLTWTPTFADSGNHSVTFTATSSTQGSAISQIHVANVDRAPVVAAADTISVLEGNMLTLAITASDPDGDAIATLSADLSAFPLPNDAQFTPAGDNLSGTLTWNTVIGDVGVYDVPFTATNALTGRDTTEVTVALPIEPPGPPLNLAGELKLPIRASLWLKMDEGSGQTANDASGNANHGRLGSATGADANDPIWVSGHSGSALQFDGTNDYVNIPSSPSLNPPATGFTIEAWVKQSGAGGNTILNKGQSGERTYRVRVTSGGGVEFRWETASTRNEIETPAGTIPPDIWHHLACVYDAAAGLNRVFVDGVQVGTGAASGTPFQNSDPLTIGARFSGTSITDGFGGSIDDLRITPEVLYTSNFTPGLVAGGPSLEASATVAGSTIQLEAAPGIPGQVVLSEGVVIDLTWSPPVSGGGFAGYNVYRSVTGGPMTRLNAAAVTTTAYTDSNVVEGLLCYEVRAISDESATFEGAPSNQVCIEFITEGHSAPVVTAPANVSGSEMTLVTVNVTVSDADGDPVGSLTADLSNLPLGNDAVFTPAADNKSGTLTWTPTFLDGPGSYDVTFTATNSLLATATTSITVVNNDRVPVVVAPETASGAEEGVITVEVTASDADGEAITSLSADVSHLPANHNAVFTPAADHLSGTLVWTPTLNDAPGPYPVFFIAANAAAGRDTTSIMITNVDQAPVVASPDTATAAEGAQLRLIVAVADPDGDAVTSLIADYTSLPAGHDAAFTPAANQLSGTLTWTPVTGDSGGVFPVTFTATNTQSGMKTTYIKVGGPDQPPVLTAPVSVAVDEASTISVLVTANDADGDPINSLTANLSSLPIGHNAVFSVAADHKSGTLVWTPTLDDAPGPYSVTFTASNAISGAVATSITVNDVPVLPPGAPQNLNANLVIPITSSLYLPMNTGSGQVATDASGNGNHGRLGTATGADAGDPIWVPGRSGTALQFDGANDYLDIPSSPSLNPPATGFTIELWVRRLGGGGSTILNKGQSGHRTYRVRVSSSGAVEFRWETSSARNEITFPAGTIPDASWSHLACVYDAAAGLNRVFVDGVQVGTGAASGTPIQNSDPLTIGARFSGTSLTDAFAGSMDDLRISPEALYTNNFTPPSLRAGAGSLEAEIGQLSGFQSLGAPTSTHFIEAARGASLLAGETVNLTWSAPASGGSHAGYNVYRSVTGGPFSKINAALVTGTTFTDPNVVVGNLCYQVRAESDGAPGLEGLPSNTACTQFVPSGQHAPVVTAPASVSGAEQSVIAVTVTANDSDGDAITSLTADLSALPAGHNAVFTPNASKTAGTLTWTPGYLDAPGPYSVTFTAANALVGTQTTSIAVGNNDRAPVVTAPVSAGGTEQSVMSVNVTADDPDGEAITSLTANLSVLPAGHNAVFTPAADKKSGTLVWTPTLNDAPGPYGIVFTASNALSGNSTTTVTVANVDQAPVVASPDTALAAEGTQLTVHVNVTDPDGDAVASLTADHSALTGATFTAAANKLSGTLTWTPSVGDSGNVFPVSFTATNSQTTVKTTHVKVGGPNTPPVVTAPVNASGNEGTVITVNVMVTDPDGEPIQSLVANLTGLPAGHNAVFTAAANKQSGTLTWTPAFTSAPGPYVVSFTATNTLSSVSNTSITVGDVPPGAPQNLSATLALPVTTILDLQMNEGSGQSTADASGNGNHAQLGTGTGADAGDPVWVAGHNGGGLRFDGMNDILQIPDSPSLDPPSSGFTIELWFQRMTGSGHTILNKGQSGHRTYRVRVTNTGGIEFRWETTTGSRNEVSLPGGTASLNQWHHLACVYDATAGLNRVFLDGVQVGTGSASGVPAQNADPLTIGARYSGSTITGPYGGMMDQLRIVPEALYTSNFTPTMTGGPLAESLETVQSAGEPLQSATTSAEPGNTLSLDAVGPGLEVAAASPRVNMTWAAPSSGGPVAGYNIYRSVGGGSATKINSVLVTATSYADTVLVAGNLCYTVKAVGSAPAGVEGAASNASCLTYTTAATHPAEEATEAAATEGLGPNVPGTFTARFAPNPMRTTGVLNFTLTRGGPVRVEVFDARGRRVQQLVDATYMEPGAHRAEVSGGDPRGRLESGVYFYRIQATEGVITGRFVLTR